MFKQDNKAFKYSIEIQDLFKIVKLILLLIVAYNSMYLKSIQKVLETLGQKEQVIVNIGAQPTDLKMGNAKTPTTTGMIGAQPTDLKMGNAKTPTTPGMEVMANNQAPESIKPLSDVAKSSQTPTESQQPKMKEALAPEPNPNPTTHKVEMLNNSPEGAMVFNPPYIHIKTGDSIEFAPVSYGHNVQTPEEIIGSDMAIPKGSETFKGAMNEKLIVKFTKPGIYLYVCNYHYIVGHVGVIQVGNDSHNIDTVREAGKKLKEKIFSHPERVDIYLDQVKIF